MIFSVLPDSSKLLIWMLNCRFLPQWNFVNKTYSLRVTMIKQIRKIFVLKLAFICCDLTSLVQNFANQKWACTKVTKKRLFCRTIIGKLCCNCACGYFSVLLIVIHNKAEYLLVESWTLFLQKRIVCKWIYMKDHIFELRRKI